MSESFSVRWAASTLKAAGLGAVLLGALALAVIGWGVVSVAGVLLGPSPKALTSNTIDKEQAAKRATQFDGYLAQINGRSLLITPRAAVEGRAGAARGRDAEGSAEALRVRRAGADGDDAR